MSGRVQVSVASVQLQSVPLNAVAVSEAGSVSITVTVSLVAPEPTLLTASVLVAPVCPWVKFPLCALLMVRSGNWLIVVGSLAELLVVFVSPPPDTVAVLVTLEGALEATFTVRGIAGELR